MNTVISDSTALPDFSVFVVSCRRLNLELDELPGKRGSKDGGRLHVAGFYGSGQLDAGLL